MIKITKFTEIHHFGAQVITERYVVLKEHKSEDFDRETVIDALLFMTGHLHKESFRPDS